MLIASPTFQVFTEIKQIPPSDNKDKTWTGDGYVRVKDGSIFEFTMVRVPNSGNYDVVIRYKVEVSIKVILFLQDFFLSTV